MKHDEIGVLLAGGNPREMSKAPVLCDDPSGAARRAVTILNVIELLACTGEGAERKSVARLVVKHTKFRIQGGPGQTARKSLMNRAGHIRGPEGSSTVKHVQGRAAVYSNLADVNLFTICFCPAAEARERELGV